MIHHLSWLHYHNGHCRGFTTNRTHRATIVPRRRHPADPIHQLRDANDHLLSEHISVDELKKRAEWRFDLGELPLRDQEDC